jgi:hypothetical protein
LAISLGKSVAFPASVTYNSLVPNSKGKKMKKVFQPRFNDDRYHGNFYIFAENPELALTLAEQFLQRCDPREYAYFAGKGWALSSVVELNIVNGIIPL